MPTRINVVKGVEDDIKSLEPRDVESGVLDVVVIGFDRNVRVEGVRRLFGNLLECQRILSHSRNLYRCPYQCLRLLDVLVAKQKLAVEVAEIDGVKVDNVDLAKAGEDEVLKQLAADAASPYHEYARLLPVRDLIKSTVAVSVAPF